MKMTAQNILLKVPKHGQELYFFSIQDIYVMLCLWCFSIQLLMLKPHTSTRVSETVCALRSLQVIFRRQLRRGFSVLSMKKIAKNTKNASIFRKPHSLGADNI